MFGCDDIVQAALRFFPARKSLSQDLLPLSRQLVPFCTVVLTAPGFDPAVRQLADAVPVTET